MKAIVLGASGYLGKAIVKALIKEGISVLALARKELSLNDFDIHENNKSQKELLSFYQIDAEHILDLKNIEQISDFCKTKDVVFYNTIWKGASRLKDGSLSEQFKNVTYASNAVIIAALLKCSKFVHVSTQDEVLYDNFLKNWKTELWNTNDLGYASAKHTAKQMCLIQAYIHKIDFINTRFSAAIDKSLKAPSFIAQNLLKIRNNQDFVSPSNPSKIEINYLEDLANAYVAIGKYGKNKADYYIGQGNLHTIKEYFDIAYALKNNNFSTEKFKNSQKKSQSVVEKLFDNSSFIKDTNFSFKYNLVSMLKEIVE